MMKSEILKIKAMTQEQIQGNKLIAEFMGKSIYPVRGTKEFKKWKGSPCDYEEFEVKYHSSLDWLMPAIEKISKDFSINIHSYPGMGFNTTIKEGNFRRGYGESEKLIEATWLAVVEFIKWYNQNKNS